MPSIDIFIDVDGTLIDIDGNPRPFVGWFFEQLHTVHPEWSVYVWSAGGVPYAQSRVNQLERRLRGPLHVCKVLAKGLGFPRSVLAFFIDDHEGLITEAEYHGWGTYLLPFYDGETGDDHLVKAYHHLEDYARRADSNSLSEGERI